MANIIRTESFAHNEWNYFVEMDANYVVHVHITDRYGHDEVVDRLWADAETADEAFNFMVSFYK
jgi:hypothetical protein